MERRLSSLEVRKTDGVFFHVHRTTSFSSRLSGPMAALPYEHQPVDIGGAKVADTGVFTVPRAGVYAFHLSGFKLQLLRDEATEVSLLHNRQLVATTKAASGTDHGALSLSAVIQLRRGDRVETVVRSAGTGHDVTIGDLHVHFTGYLLMAADEE